MRRRGPRRPRRPGSGRGRSRRRRPTTPAGSPSARTGSPRAWRSPARPRSRARWCRMAGGRRGVAEDRSGSVLVRVRAPGVIGSAGAPETRRVELRDSCVGHDREDITGGRDAWPDRMSATNHAGASSSRRRPSQAPRSPASTMRFGELRTRGSRSGGDHAGTVRPSRHLTACATVLGDRANLAGMTRQRTDEQDQGRDGWAYGNRHRLGGRSRASSEYVGWQMGKCRAVIRRGQYRCRPVARSGRCQSAPRAALRSVGLPFRSMRRPGRTRFGMLAPLGAGFVNIAGGRPRIRLSLRYMRGLLGRVAGAFCWTLLVAIRARLGPDQPAGERQQSGRGGPWPTRNS